MVRDDLLFNILLTSSIPAVIATSSGSGPYKSFARLLPQRASQRGHDKVRGVRKNIAHGCTRQFLESWKPRLPRTPKRFLEPTCLITEDATFRGKMTVSEVGADLAGTICHSLQMRMRMRSKAEEGNDHDDYEEVDQFDVCIF